MARFSVPSASPPSTPGSHRSSASPRSSPRTPPVYTSCPNTFRVPSVTSSAPGDRDADDERSPSTSPVYTNGPNTFRVPSSHGTPSITSGRGSRSPSDPPQTQRSTGSHGNAITDTPGPQRRDFNSLSARENQVGNDNGVFMPGSFNGLSSRFGSPDSNHKRRFPSPSPEAPGPQRQRYNFRPAQPMIPRDESGARETTPVLRGVSCVPNIPSSSSSSSSTGSDDNDRGDNGGSTGDGNVDGGDNFIPSDHSSISTDFSNEELPVPGGYQPWRRPGRLGASQPHPSKSLTLLKERPGRLPAHTARSPTSPGFDWGDGAAWWHPAGSGGNANIVREIFTPSGSKHIEQAVAEDTMQLVYHENLINILDGDGFGADQPDVRPEVLCEFCAGGTLNKVILSRRPEAPILKPRRPATHLPTRAILLGLSEDLIWHVLLSLLQATYWLHHRQFPVVHCAVDPANVFFTAPRPDDRRPLVRRYGLVKLGNFSKAVILPHRMDPDGTDDEEIQARCRMFEHIVTDPYQETGYEAPELLGMLGEDEVSDEKIFPGPCSDLFSIGATCFAMMTGKTIWDLLLERRFISRSLEPARMDCAVLEEKWRFADYEERMELLGPLLRGDQILGAALPDLYSASLRDLVISLLNLDPEMRGESAALLDEAEDAFAEKNTDEIWEGMRRRWRRATMSPVGSKGAVEKAMRDWERQFGPEMVAATRRSEARGPLVP